MDVADDARARALGRVGGTLRGDKYVLERLLGVGAMGAVYAASHRNGMRIAIKILHPELSKIDEVRRRFLREGYLANRITHPGSVKILDDDVDNDGSTFLVMELLEGRTLEAEWNAVGFKLPAMRVAQITDLVLDVLSAIHAEGIVHRDIKPDNVFMTTSGNLKLLDLGIARLVESRGMTASGQLMGTPEFAAPEQAGGHVHDIDGRTDLYSVGAMMFTLLTGEPVHPARTAMEHMIFAATKPARSLLDVWTNAPPTLVNIVDVALAFDKTKRWSSAAQMQMAVRNSIPSLGDAAFNSIATKATIPAPPQVGKTGTLLVGSPQPVSETQAIPLARKRT